MAQAQELDAWADNAVDVGATGIAYLGSLNNATSYSAATLTGAR